MLSTLLIPNPISISISISISFSPTINWPQTFGLRFKRRAFVRNSSSSFTDQLQNKPSVHYDTLRVLEWDKLCDSVASFARTSLGRQETKAQLWSLGQSYEVSLRLLDETNAAVEIIKHGRCSLDFTGVDVLLVQSAIRHARRSLPVEGSEAMAVVSLLQYADALQVSLKATLNEDADWYRRFMPLTDVIMGFVVNRSLVKWIQQVIDEDGSVKDSASPNLKRSHDQVRTLERRVYQLIDNLIRKTKNESSLMDACNIDGRWCIKSSADQQTGFKALLLSSSSGIGSIVEPLSAVSLNDQLQEARASVAKAEADVLSMLSSKMQKDLEDIEMLLNSIIQLDVVNARATYGLSYGGSCPNIFLLRGSGNVTASVYLSKNEVPNTSLASKREWVLYMPKAYHPLLLQQHRQNLRKTKKDSKNASAVGYARPKLMFLSPVSFPF